MHDSQAAVPLQPPHFAGVHASRSCSQVVTALQPDCTAATATASLQDSRSHSAALQPDCSAATAATATATAWLQDGRSRGLGGALLQPAGPAATAEVSHSHRYSPQMADGAGGAAGTSATASATATASTTGLPWLWGPYLNNSCAAVAAPTAVADAVGGGAHIPVGACLAGCCFGRGL